MELQWNDIVPKYIGMFTMVSRIDCVISISTKVLRVLSENSRLILERLKKDLKKCLHQEDSNYFTIFFLNKGMFLCCPPFAILNNY